MILRLNWREVDSEWLCSNPNLSLFYQRFGVLLADFLGVLVGSFLTAILLEALPDFFAAFEALDFSLFSAAFDLLLCFTGVM